MAAKINVEIQPAVFKLTAGESAEATATLHNRGQSVDQLTVSIDGLDPAWYTLPVSSVALFPNDQDQLKIVFHPPATAETKAATYPFRLVVTSQEDPSETATAELSIEIGGLPSLELSINPQSISGSKGNYDIIVTNSGDSEAKANLKCSGAEGILVYHLQPESVTVPANGRAQATLEVRQSILSRLLGGQKELQFEVTAVPAEGGRLSTEAARTTGRFIRIPWYKGIKLPWLSRPPAITDFKATTDDRWEFALSWSARRAKQVTLNDEAVKRQGELTVRPTKTTDYVLTATNKYGTATKTVEVSPLAAPEARASERIRASLSPTGLQADAGGIPVQATLQLQNLGDVVDKFVIEIEGLDESWYSRSASSIALMPQATDQVQLTFKPPKSKGVKARAYPFAVTVHSQSAPAEMASIVGQLEVKPVVEFKLSVAPYRVTCRKKGSYRISLANTGVSDAAFTLDATDLDEGLNFRFKSDQPTVPAWRTIEIPMVARPKRGSSVGERKRYDVTITATADGGSSQTVNCELHHKPFMASWKPVLRILRILIFLAIIGVIVYFVLDWGGGWRTLSGSPQTWVNNLIRTVEGWFFR